MQNSRDTSGAFLRTFLFLHLFMHRLMKLPAIADNVSKFFEHLCIVILSRSKLIDTPVVGDKPIVLSSINGGSISGNSLRVCL